MRKNFIRVFAATALTLSFAACSQNDIVPDNGVITPEMATSYAKVNISMAGGTGTRAMGETSDDFEKGTPEESAVNSLTILLFDGNTMVGSGSTTTFYAKDNDEVTESPSVSHEYGYDVEKTAVIKVSLEPGHAKPTKMLAFVNTDANYLTYQDALDAIATDVKNGDAFVMTSALNSSGEVATTIDPGTELFYTEEEAIAAQDGAISIYVERLAAKLSVKKTSDEIETEAAVTLTDVDEKSYTINFDTETAKWAATGTARKMFTFKQMWTEDNLNWAKSETYPHRSYWAKGVLYDTPYSGATGYLNEELENNKLLDYLSASQIISAADAKSLGSGVTYMKEHTFGAAAMNSDGVFEPKITGTNAIIVGQYVVNDENGEPAERFLTKEKDKNNQAINAYDFYLTKAGASTDKPSYIIYSRTDMIRKLLKVNEVELDEEIDDDNLYEYFDVVLNDDNSAFTLKLQDDAEVSVDGEELSANDLAELIKTHVAARHYRSGWAYFFAPIKHNDGNDKSVGTYGVVRNHAYELNINKIIGLGAPLDDTKIGPDPTNPKTEPDPDPDDPIIPDPDEIKEAWIDATLKVLSWHVISQGVDL